MYKHLAEYLRNEGGQYPTMQWNILHDPGFLLVWWSCGWKFPTSSCNILCTTADSPGTTQGTATKGCKAQQFPDRCWRQFHVQEATTERHYTHRHAEVCTSNNVYSLANICAQLVIMCHSQTWNIIVGVLQVQLSCYLY